MIDYGDLTVMIANNSKLFIPSKFLPREHRTLPKRRRQVKIRNTLHYIVIAIRLENQITSRQDNKAAPTPTPKFPWGGMLSGKIKLLTHQGKRVRYLVTDRTCIAET